MPRRPGVTWAADEIDGHGRLVGVSRAAISTGVAHVGRERARRQRQVISDLRIAAHEPHVGKARGRCACRTHSLPGRAITGARMEDERVFRPA
jgi:hypothetical protein